MNKPKYLYLNSRDEFYRIDSAKIVYFEGDGNYTNIVLTNGSKVTICMNLAHMQDSLRHSIQDSATLFARVGKRHIINLSYVYRIAIVQQKLVLSDVLHFEYSLAISKEALRGLRDMYISSKPQS